MIMMALLVSVSVLTACQKDQSGKTADDGQKTGQVEITQTDLTGSWQDEVSQRATMDATKKDDGSYDIVVSWGSSASEKSTWEIHGTFDEATGVLSYEDGAYSVHTWDDNDQETISGEETTKGSFIKEGDKLRWKDSKNSDDGLFVKDSE